MKFEESIRNIINNKTEYKDIIIKKQKTGEFGDYSIILFPVSKKTGKKIEDIAEDIKKALEDISEIDSIELINGFLNISLDANISNDRMWEKALNFFEKSKSQNKGKVIIDYSSPNIAKPFSIGHLRSTIIGNVLANIYEEAGFEVLRVNHLGDWGTQFGKVIVAIKKWGDLEKIKLDPVKELLALYVRFHEEQSRFPELEDEAREAFKRLEQKDREYYELWEYIVEVSIENIEKIYKRLGVRFDRYMGESFYEPFMENTMKRLVEAGLVSESQGAWVVDFGDNSKMPPCLLKKKDGASLYALRDVTALLYRIEELKGDRLLYVVGNEQKLHFSQVFKVCEKFNKDFFGKMEHVGFGLYKFRDSKMSTRKGNVIFMEDVLDEACEKVKELMKDRGFTKEELDDIAEKVGTGAVIFNDISSDRNKDVDFSWEKVLDLNGETAPYVQYTAVRIKSILNKASYNGNKIKRPDLNFEEYNDTLRHIDDFENVLERAGDKNQPHIITGFLITLCGHFNSFYNKKRVLCEDKEERDSHVEFINVILLYIKKGLDILGIKIPEKM